ncbi:DUF5753 domain-containing protein [Nocardia sp. BMG51109]|uniref:DUF5753 domain-containing protein n=1 Tax=Nocardia sp. BMG51109 TaxID=1056816 RepID=UPI0004650CAB|nr:DUF5753 domain-containing protein [Nocardia sp. BMG51109]
MTNEVYDAKEALGQQLREIRRRAGLTGHPARDADTRLTRWHETGLIPGLLQTRDYATAVLRACQQVIDGPDDLAAAVETRMRRQDILATGVHRFNFLLAEQCLHTRVGDTTVMIEQLTRLLDLHHNPRIALAITPRDSQFRYPTTNFGIFDRTTVQVETVTAEVTVTQPREITLYERVFDFLLATAVIGESARSLIEAAINHYRQEKR